MLQMALDMNFPKDDLFVNKQSVHLFWAHIEKIIQQKRLNETWQQSLKTAFANADFWYKYKRKVKKIGEEGKKKIGVEGVGKYDFFKTMT